MRRKRFAYPRGKDFVRTTSGLTRNSLLDIQVMPSHAISLVLIRTLAAPQLMTMFGCYSQLLRVHSAHLRLGSLELEGYPEGHEHAEHDLEPRYHESSLEPVRPI
jgi:hypothetical protein